MLTFYNDFEYATRGSAAKRSPLFYIHLYLEVKPVAALPLPYYYGYEAEQFSFYRIPKRLVEDDRFRGVSTDAKLLYGMLLDRMALSIKNGWLDEQGRVFIYYPADEIMSVLHCRSEKAAKLMAELDCKKGIGLIERVNHGQGRPTMIYVKNFAALPPP